MVQWTFYVKFYQLGTIDNLIIFMRYYKNNSGVPKKNEQY